MASPAAAERESHPGFSTPPIRLAWTLLAALCALSFFWRLGANGLWDLDEALYTEAAREMRLSGDFVTPRVNGQPFFEKPPLIYWEAAALFSAAGPSELTARLPSALASSALVAIIFVVGFRRFGPREGLVAAAFFALSPLAFGAARQLTTDATLDLCVASALLCMFSALEPEPRGRVSALGFWLCCGLGVLAKGLPGILIPTLVGGIYLGMREKWGRGGLRVGIARMRPLAGLAIFVAVVAPWHLLAWVQSGPAFVHEYIVVQHLARFRGGDTAHRAPFWFFVPGFLAGFFPLSVYLPAALLDRRLRGDTADRLRLLLKIWAVTVFVVFSASGSKLISYILPMYPPAALLAGDWCIRAMKQDRGMAALRKGSWVIVLLSGLPWLALLCRDPLLAWIAHATRRPVNLADIPPGTFEWAAHLFAVLTVGAAVYAVLLQMRRPAHAFVALMAAMALFLGVAVAEGLPLLSGSLVAPLQRAATTAGARAAEQGAPLILVIGPPRRPSTLFYAPDSLLRPDRRGAATSITEVVGGQDGSKSVYRLLEANPGAVVLTEDTRVSLLQRRFPMALIDRVGRWVVLQSPAKAP